MAKLKASHSVASVDNLQAYEDDDAGPDLRTSPTSQLAGNVFGPAGGGTDVLQHFEFAVITAVSNLGNKAYPAELARHLSGKLNRHVSLAQVFIALERLEDKNFLSSEETKPESVRGGRRRRVFKVEASGVRALKNTAVTKASSSLFEETIYVARQRPFEPNTA